MATENGPAFQFYPTDFLADDAVALMTNEQVGAYILLLCHAWKCPQGLPACESALARLTRCTATRFRRSIWPAVACKFQHNEAGRLFNPRLEIVRAEQIAYRERCEKAGRASATARQQKRQHNGNITANITATEPPTELPTEGQQEGQHKGNSLSVPSSSPSSKNTETETRFDQFWLAYPRKVGKDDARRAFSKRKVSGELLETMLAALGVQCAADAWTREGGRFIPNPATWLNQGRWQDELADGPIAAPSDLELREARDIYNRNWGGRCHHEEPHKGSAECIRQIAIDRRLKRSA